MQDFVVTFQFAGYFFILEICLADYKALMFNSRVQSSDLSIYIKQKSGHHSLFVQSSHGPVLGEGNRNLSDTEGFGEPFLNILIAFIAVRVHTCAWRLEGSLEESFLSS